MVKTLESDTQIVPRHLKITPNGLEEYVPAEQKMKVSPSRWTPRVQQLFGGDILLRRTLLGF